MQKMQDMQVRSLGWEDPLEEEMANQSSILPWRITRTEELGGLQSMGLWRVRHDCVRTHTHTHTRSYSKIWENIHHHVKDVIMEGNFKFLLLLLFFILVHLHFLSFFFLFLSFFFLQQARITLVKHLKKKNFVKWHTIHKVFSKMRGWPLLADK